MVVISSFENDRILGIGAFSLQIQFAAAAIASSFLLLFLPNIETITITVFLAGYLFTRKFGITTLLIIVFSWEILVSSIFAFSGIIFPFKIIGWGIVLLLGNLARWLQVSKSYEFMIFGITSAIIWDSIVSIATPLTLASDPAAFWTLFIVSIIGGIPFTFLHALGNFYFFAMIPTILDSILPPLELHYNYLLQRRIKASHSLV